MAYKVIFTNKFDKEFYKLDHYTQSIVITWIEKHISNCENPRIYGKALLHERSGQWRYRIGYYRLICEIQDNKLIILALFVGHRKEIYK